MPFDDEDDDDFLDEEDDVPEFKETNKTGAPSQRRTCPRCGRLGHLARTCSGNPKSHFKIGIEIEGWWRDLNAAKATAREYGATGVDDGSLDTHPECPRWEFRTHPGSLGEAINQLAALYPDFTNPSAGMHVHVSFNDVCDLSVLASSRFLDYHRARWEAWGTRMNIHRDSNFWARLNGQNQTYCALNRADQLHRSPFSGSRYVQLNFTSYTRHKTLENRMLPLFRDLKLAIAAVEEMISIYEDFLRDADALTLHDLRKAHDIVAELPERPGRPVVERRRPINVVLDSPVNDPQPVALVTRAMDMEVRLADPARPITPGTTRVFGRYAARNYVLNQLEEQELY